MGGLLGGGLLSGGEDPGGLVGVGGGWGGGVRVGRFRGYMPPRPSVGPSQAPLTSPCPPSNHIKTEYWDRAGGGGNISYD